MNNQSIYKFIQLNCEAATMLKRMLEHVENNCDVMPSDVNYGHVGDAAYNLQQIRNLHDRIFNEGEYK